MSTDPLKEWENIQELRAKSQDATERWLRSRGWKCSSDTPNCCWMWTKEWDGKTFLVSEDAAIDFQARWDTAKDVELHPEKYEDE